MSQRSAAKRVKYDVDLSDGDASGDDEDADKDKDEDSRGGFQKLKRQPRMPAAAKKASPLASQKKASPLAGQKDPASQQEAEPMDSAAGTPTAKRRLSMTAMGNGQLASVPEEGDKETTDEPGITQRDTLKDSQTEKGRQKARQQEVCSALSVVLPPCNNFSAALTLCMHSVRAPVPIECSRVAAAQPLAFWPLGHRPCRMHCSEDRLHTSSRISHAEMLCARCHKQYP